MIGKTITLFIILLLTVNAGKLRVRDSIPHLNPEKFNEAIKDNTYFLVLFYSPQCSHCKAFLPTFDKIAETLSQRTNPVLSGKVDVLDSQNEPLLDTYEVRGWPKVILFVNGVAQKYTGDKVEHKILHWISGLKAN
jgi:protein disulfide-isomerase A1